jgi:hypothetical protein
MKKLSFFLMAMFLTLCVTNAWAADSTVKFGTDWNAVFGTSYNGTFNPSKNALTLTGTIDAVTLTAKNGTSTNGYVKTGDWRLYNGYTLTIAVQEGNAISMITAKKGAKTITGITANEGNLEIPSGGASMTWTGNTNEVVFSISATMGFSEISVTYSATGSTSKETTSLTWSADAYAATIGAENTFPTLTTDPVDLEGVTYSSSNVAAATIAADGTITLVAPGTTNITASFAGNETHYAATAASYKLTVKNSLENAVPYELHTGNLVEGDYVVFYANNGMKAQVVSNRLSYTEYIPEADVIYDPSADDVWHISKNGDYWTLYNAATAKYAAGNGTKNQAALVDNVGDATLWTATMTDGTFEFVNKKNNDASVNKNLRYNAGYGFACYGTSTGGALSLYKKVVANDAVTSPIISGNAEFVESTEVTIVAEDGLKVYYTLDGTDPTNASTEYTAPFELTATTTVKAVAYYGENASEVVSKTFKKLQVLTCEEAADACTSTESADKYVIRGYVTNIASAWSDQYNNTSFWMADTKNGGKVFEAFRATPVVAADKSVKVGDYVEVIGNLVLYGTTPETVAGGTYTIIPAPVVNVTHDFYAEGVTVSEGGWSINLLGSWNEQAFTVMLWQDNTQGFGTYAADAETGYTATLGVKELTPTAPGYYTDMQDGTFTFQGTMTDGTDIYEVFLKGALASSTGTGELEAKNEVYFTYEDGEWMIEAFADDQTWGLMLAVSAETDPETGENLVYGQYVTDIEAGITEEVAGTCQLYFDDFSGCYVFKGGLATASGNIYPTLYASSLTLMTNDLVTGPSWVGEFAGVDYYEVLMMAADYSWELDLHARNCTGANGTYTIDVVDEAEGAYSTFMGSTIVTGELTIEDGMYEANVTTVDSEGNPAMSISVLAWAAAAEEYDIVITDATVTDNTSGYNIDLTGEWEGHDIKVEVCDELTAETILANFFFDGGIANDGDQAEGEVTATVSEGVVTITGTFESLGSGNVYNVTISGTLPVVEPTTITYELNGGEIPAVVVPTNAELELSFKKAYLAYFGIEETETDLNREMSNFLYATNGKGGNALTFMTLETSEWKWLADYILAVTNAQIEAGTLASLKELATELMWRTSVAAFFNASAKLDSNYKGNADFTEAGKPENWGAAYEAAHEVVLPTEPVAEDYVLPTPTKSGCTFKGWYDNAEGIGEAYTVIPAGWAGTLYAIWEQGTTTALENIAVEGKAVKAIINGQLIIIKNGVQYNVQGQVIK